MITQIGHDFDKELFGKFLSVSICFGLICI